MKIVTARKAGFCMGVKRALEMVLDRARREEKGIVTYGPLIHNPQVVSLLSSKRISASRDRGSLKPGEICFISAHGISPEVRRELKATGARLCDASCPDVLKVQGTIRKYARRGYATVIFGDPGHSEVEGLLGFTEGKGVVISDPGEVAGLPDFERVCLVSQTTQNLEEFREAARELKKRFPEAEVFETICSSTLERQREVEELASRVDALVVVGGKNSANTARLTRIGSGRVPVLQVETAEDLDRETLKDYRTVGVTAGASTPSWLIQEVVDRLRDWSWLERNPVLKFLYRVGSALVKSNIYIALGGACLTGASMRLLQLPLSIPSVLLSFFLVLAVYNLNIFADRTAILITQPSRYRFLLARRRELSGLSAFSLAAAFLLAASLGTAAFLLTVFTLLSGLAYTFSFLPTALPGVRLNKLTGLKEFFSSLGWGVLAVLIPVLSAPVSPPGGTVSVLVVFVFVFAILFSRSVLFAIRDLQGDRLVGRETIPAALGVGRTRWLLTILLVFAAGLLVLAAARGWIAPVGFYFPAVIAYGGLNLAIHRQGLIYRGLPQETLADSQLILAGLLSLTG